MALIRMSSAASNPKRFLSPVVSTAKVLLKTFFLLDKIDFAGLTFDLKKLSDADMAGIIAVILNQPF